MTAGHVIPAFKKIGELLGDYLGHVTGIEVLNYRIAGIWGPLRPPRVAVLRGAPARARRGPRHARRTSPRCTRPPTPTTGPTCAT